MITPRLSRWLAAAACVCGIAAWIRFLDAGLVLSHYDAKAHLVVARRVIDSITPGWQQIGAVWLPLPHLIQILPTQIDFFYRTGMFGSMVSIASFTVLVWSAAHVVLRFTGSALGATTAAALLIANPNLLYLQSTPMTEPLMLALVFVVVLGLYEVSRAGGGSNPAEAGLHGNPAEAGRHRWLGWALCAAVWTRYEAWPIVAVGIAATAVARVARGTPILRTAALITRLAAWPAAAVVAFLALSRVTTGQWFVTGGFYEVDPTYHGLALKSLVAVWWGTHRLTGYVVEIGALAAAAWLVVRVIGRFAGPRSLILLAPFAAAALPFSAFVEGHPFRVRYMVVLAAACAFTCGILVGQLRSRRVRTALAAGLLIASLVESPPWSLEAPMIVEAQWDVPRTRERQDVTSCLRAGYRGGKILASMGSLAHYMQELSADGFHIADFIHEGNGALWELALTSNPADHAAWMIVEEQSEGGDRLARRVRDNPVFAAGMQRVCAGGGVALYRKR